MRMADYFFMMNEFCCHGALFLWQLKHFMNMWCLSNIAAMATFTRILHKIIANLVDKICYYASRMNYPSLNGSLKLQYLTNFKCALLQILGERGGSVVECRTPEREVGRSKPTAALLCP